MTTVGDDGWDWPFLLYVGLAILHVPEKYFWRITPRKFQALVRSHATVNSSEGGKHSGKQKEGHIDDVDI